MSMKQYLELQEARSQHTLKSVQPAKESKDFPCRGCDGGGIMVEKVTYWKVADTSRAVTRGDNTPISSLRIIECPSCYGTGVDHALMQRTLQAELQKGAA